MTLRSFFEEHGISLVKAIPRSFATIRKPHLLPEDGGDWLIVMAVPYRLPSNASSLSDYAVVKDYHGFFASIFDSTRSFLKEKYPSGIHYGFSDHSPFEEVRLAALSGLGVIGDNGLLITERFGSYVFIGEIITTLTEDKLAREEIPICHLPFPIVSCLHCGQCAKVCPGNCLPSFSRETCASHLSQKKGQLSSAEEAILQKSAYIWGCDHCQSVCPMNRKAEYTTVSYFTEDNLTQTPPEEILTYTDDKYNQYPFSWRKKEILGRNITLSQKKKGDAHD